jgi:metal-responsive CopG/Arc/MetJ family transcriptional regulator
MEDECDTVRLTISLPRSLYAEVMRISKRESRSRAWVVRKGLEALVKQEEPLLNP